MRVFFYVYRKATLKEKLGDKENTGLSSYESATYESTAVAPKMIHVQETKKSE